MADPGAAAEDRRSLGLACAALAAAWLAYAVVVVREFDGPFIAAGDANYFDYLSFHVAEHLQWRMPPLEFRTDEVGYPQGTSIVYLSWCIERDLLLAAARRLFGEGPWLQLYCAASPGIGAFGTLVLLRRDVGVLRATLVAFAGSFMAFYAAYKYPLHLNMSVLHWATLSIVVDWLVVRRVVEEKRLSARLLAARAALLPMLLGIDLPYVAGYALASFAVTTLFCVAWLVKLRRAGRPVRELFPRDVRGEMRAHPASFALLFAFALVGTFVYFPGTLLILKASRVYVFGDAGGNFWASPLKLLIPFFPFANPDSPWVHALFGEEDGLAEFSVGWALVLAAALGVRSAWRRKALAAFVPLLVTFVLCFAFHPKRLPTLYVFPWFAFNRVAGRATVFFPLFFALLALGYERGSARRLPAVVAVLAVVETLTGYAISARYRPARYDASIAGYMEAVRRAPGEALLDWPLCIAGANGVGTRELCPYYRFLSTAYSNRRFHRKKVVGFYLSRTHPTQLEARKELATLFSPDDPDPHLATHETRCFDDAQWATFTSFYRAHDFGGVELYTELLPAACVEEFHRRFGAPVAATNLPRVGRTEFLVGGR